MNLIVVPVCNSLAMTKRCIQSCLDQDISGGVHVLAIDNGSNDGTGPWLRSLAGSTPVMTVSHSRPRSLNRVWNESLTLAFRSMRLDYALVINNDILLRPDAYRLLAADGGGFVTGVAVAYENEMDAASPDNRSPHPSFSCFLIRRDVWDRVGRFDEEYWAYCSDADYHLRMDRLDIDACALAIPFYHEVSGTMKHADNATRDLIQQRADADRATFERRWGFAVGSPEYYAAFRHTRENRYESSGRLD